MELAGCGRDRRLLLGRGTPERCSPRQWVGRGKGVSQGEVGAGHLFGKHAWSEDWAAGLSWMAASLVVESKTRGQDKA